MNSRFIYQLSPGDYAPGEAIPILVKLDRTPVGVIHAVDGGWQYTPRGQREGGEVFKTVQEVKNDIEGAQ